MNYSVGKKSLYIVLVLTLTINVTSHLLTNVFGIGNVYYTSYLCWLFIFCVSVFFIDGSTKKREIIIAALVLLIGFIGALGNLSKYPDSFLDFHRSFFISIAYVVTMGIVTKKSITEDEVYKLMRVIVIIGSIAALYATLAQGEYAILVLKRIRVDWNSWFYKSFFAQRNIYGEYCFISTIAGLYNYLKKRKKIYLMYVFLMGFEIYITNSRGALLAYILLVGLTVFFSIKNKWILIILVIVSNILFLYCFGLDIFFTSNLSHTTSFNVDSGKVRLMMWKDIFYEIFNDNAILFGFGQGTVEKFIFPKYNVGSSHNMYMDALFESGILYLMIMAYAILTSIKNVNKNKDKAFKDVMLAAWISFLIYGMVEAGMALYCANFFSVTVTIIFVLFPRIYNNHEKNLRNDLKEVKIQ